jgi:hypothetical protein
MPSPQAAFQTFVRRGVRLLLLALAPLVSQASPGLADVAAPLAPPLPGDASRWVGKPASWAGLRGRVTLVFVWTFG